MAALIVLIVVAVVVLITLARGIRIVPQARAGIVERLGRYHRTLDAGLALIVPTSTASSRCSTCASRWCRSRRSR